MSTTGLSALPYYGGKVRQRKWLNELLGPNRERYVEPFFGMGAVLLERTRSKVELVTDVNERVVNWWRILQTDVDALADRVTSSPYARSVYLDAIAALDSTDALERAWAFTMVVYQGRISGDGGTLASNWNVAHARPWLDLGYATRLRLLAHRVRFLRIDNRDARDVLQRVARKSDTLVYVDPPYWGHAQVDPYARNAYVDLADVLRAQEGRCVVSGYGDAYDHLGWTRHEREFRSTAGGEQTRVEVAWCNDR